MRVFIHKTESGYRAFGWDDSDVFDTMHSTAQAAFDWLAENYPGIPTEGNIQ